MVFDVIFCPSLFAIVIFFFFGVIALNSAGKIWWERVDLFYYPFVALGAILFLLTPIKSSLQEELNGDLLTLEYEYNLKAEKAQAFPYTDPAFEESGSERRMLELLQIHISTINECEETNFSVSVCAAAKDWALPYRTQAEYLQKEFDSNTEFVAQVCAGFDQILRVEIQEASPFLSTPFFDQISSSLSKKYNPYQWEATYSIRDEFVVRANQYVDSIIQDFGAEDQQYIRSAFSSNLTFASAFLSAHEFCFRLPEGLSKENLEEWGQIVFEDIAKINSEKEYLISLRQTYGAWPIYLTQFREKSWIYVLIFALALKFGKGVSKVQSLKQKLE